MSRAAMAVPAPGGLRLWPRMAWCLTFGHLRAREALTAVWAAWPGLSLSQGSLRPFIRWQHMRPKKVPTGPPWPPSCSTGIDHPSSPRHAAAKLTGSQEPPFQVPCCWNAMEKGISWDAPSPSPHSSYPPGLPATALESLVLLNF